MGKQQNNNGNATSNTTTVKTILVLAANPTSTSRLRLDEEVREIDEGLRRANKRQEFKLEQKWAVRTRDFYRAILDYRPQIVHFCGHGAGEDGLVLDDDTGQPALISAEALGSMFKLFASKGVECVLLNACYSQLQAEAISQHVNYVIGMNSTVGDQAAVAFAVAFYDAIGAGEEVEFAYELGCSQMIGFLEQQTPVLRKKALIAVPTASQIEVISPNPYQGLSAFGEEDAAFFFGRETFINDLVEAVNKQPLVAVIGPSGSGKSSVVYAGLIPKLRTAGNWLIESFRPGKEPFYELASVLVRQLEPESGETARLREAVGLATDMQEGKITLQQVISRLLEHHPGKRLLLFVDQFEELYTLCQDKLLIERFADTLLRAIAQNNLTLIFTLRADFYGYVLAYRPLRDALQQFTPQLLSSMNREELQRAIEQPAQKIEVQLEAQLTQRILDDVGNEPGNLPLLEFALTRLWSLQQNRLLTHRAYDEIGGVKKALGNHAEQVYQGLNEQAQKQAQRIFVQLVRPGEGTEDTRRIATRKEVGLENWGLVSYLAGYEARLVVTGHDEKSGEDTVEVVHEALIREWLTLREWINASRQFRLWQERLKVAMLEWKNSNYDSWALLRGVRLGVAEDWLRKRADEITQQERDFIQASVILRDKQKQERERKRQATILILVTALIVASSLTGFATYSWWRAAINEMNALTKASDALVNSNPPDALKTSLKAIVQMRHTPLVDPKTVSQVELTLFNTANNTTIPNTLGGHAKSVNDVKFSPDGKTLASASDDYTIKLWDVSTGKENGTLIGHANKVNSISFSPNGKLLASASSDQTVKLWNVRTGTSKPITNLKGHRNSINSVSFSPNGRMLASASDDQTVILWDVSSGLRINTLTGHTDVVYDVSFSPNGNMLASTSFDKTVKLWDVATGKEIRTLTGHQEEVKGLSFSPDGKLLATTSFDKTVKLWDVSSGKEIKTLIGHTDTVNHVSFSPNGKLLATTSWDKTVRLWDVSTGKEIKTLTGHIDWVSNLSFSRDMKMLASASADKTVKLWDINTGKEIKTLAGHLSWVNSVSFSPDSKILASASTDTTVKLWNTTTRELTNILNGHTDRVNSISFSSDGKMLASAGDDQRVILWNINSGEQITTFSTHQGKVNSVSFSPDSEMLASAGDDKTVKLWDVNSRKPIITLIGHQEKVNSVSFSPDGKTLASGSDDNRIKLWDVKTGKENRTLIGHVDKVKSVSFSPDGEMLASASADKTVRLWDIKSGKELKTFIGHTDVVTTVSFSPDGKMLVSASDDNTLKLWDVRSGEEIKTLVGHKDGVRSASFSPDGKMLASGSADKTVKLWRLDFDYLLKLECDFIPVYFPNSHDSDLSQINEICRDSDRRNQRRLPG